MSLDSSRVVELVAKTLAARNPVQSPSDVVDGLMAESMGVKEMQSTRYILCTR